MKIDFDRIIQTVLAALLTAACFGIFRTYVEVQMLRIEVDRLNVYVDQLWKQPK